LTTILSGLFLSGNLFSLTPGEASELVMNFRGIYRIAGESNPVLIGRIIPFSLISCLIPLVALVSIFFFKKRNLQLKLTLALIILELLLVAAGAIDSFHFIRKFDASLSPAFRMFIPFLTLTLSILAYRGIRNDENLVRSYDRLR